VTVQLDEAPAATAANPEFDLDIKIVESGPVIDTMMRLTDDNCGATCESACNSCP
jgi:FxLD family lantipeptide